MVNRTSNALECYNCRFNFIFLWDDGQTVTVTRNEGNSFRFGARQHHAMPIVGIVVALSSEHTRK
jgi:hypothetical protein